MQRTCSRMYIMLKIAAVLKSLIFLERKLFPGNYSLRSEGYVVINGNMVLDLAESKHEIFFTNKVLS